MHTLGKPPPVITDDTTGTTPGTSTSASTAAAVSGVDGHSPAATAAATGALRTHRQFIVGISSYTEGFDRDSGVSARICVYLSVCYIYTVRMIQPPAYVVVCTQRYYVDNLAERHETAI